MDKLDRVIKQQIDDATRDQKGRVKTKNVAQIANLGGTDLSGQPVLPTILWRVEDYIMPLGLYPNFNDARAALNREVSPLRTVSTLQGTLNGGFNTFVNGGDVAGVTRIFSTRMFAASPRNFVSRFKMDAFRQPKIPVTSNFYVTAMMRTEKPDGTPTGDFPNWVALAIASGGNTFHYDQTFRGNFDGVNWLTLALFLYCGYPHTLTVREAFRDLAYSADAWEFRNSTPPSPPTWGNPPLQSDYIDATIGSSKNILQINTPTEADWLGVGIYRASADPQSDFIVTGRDTIVRATGAQQTDLGRDYKWTVYDANPLVGPTQSYRFSSESLYKPNLITNGQFDYGTADWRLTDGGGGAGDIIKQVIYEPFTGPTCVKASAAYDGASRFNMILQSSSFPVDVTLDYRLQWYVRPEGSTPTSTDIPGSSNPISAIQINYYDDSNHTLDYSTPYQIVRQTYDNQYWDMYEAVIHRTSYGGTANPSGVTGASAIAEFVLPSACAYIDISFKMWDNHSANGVYYFDGANCEVDSGQALTFHTAIANGTVLKSVDQLTSQEGTDYGAARLPFLGQEDEVFAGHTTSAVGDEVYRSSAHWSKFSKGIEFSPDSKSWLNNRFFRHWDYTSWGQHKPVGWAVLESSGLYSRTQYWPTTHTSVYKGEDLFGGISTSGAMGFYMPPGPDGTVNWGGLHLTWINPAPDRAVDYATYSGWVMVSTGRVVLGDFNNFPYNYSLREKWFVLTGTPGGVYDSDFGRKGAEVLCEKDKWKYFTLPLNSAKSFTIRSDLPGTVAYFDGLNINWNEQGDGSVRSYPTLVDVVNQPAGQIRSNSYVNASSNSLNKNAWTIRCWYTPAYDWNVASSPSGICTMPHPTIWSFGDDNSSISTNKNWLAYRPWHNAASSGGYFQWTGMNTTINGMVVRSGKQKFKAMEPIHLVATYYGSENEGVAEFGRRTKLYVNGAEAASSQAVWDDAFTSVDIEDNFVIGAWKGAETSTAHTFFGLDGTTAYGNANGIISEFRADNYVWSKEQVLQDFSAQVPRPAPASPTMTLTSLKYNHLIDHIKDGSEKQSFVYEDVGVESGKYYSYALDAFDYLNNRSLLGDTASITAGDTIGPLNGYTNTSYSLNKGTNLTFIWTNPTDTDFKTTEVRWSDTPVAPGPRIDGEPGTISYYNAGFVGYGFDRTLLLLPLDHVGNIGNFMSIRGQTKKGPLRSIDGSLFLNRGYGIVDDKALLFKADSLSWGKMFYTTTNPGSPKYTGMEIEFLAENSAYPNRILAPLAAGSVTGLELNTAYYLYMTDSAGASRPNALMMRWTLDSDIMRSPTAYPLGVFKTGNNTAQGYFIPDFEAPQSLQGGTTIASRIQNTSGKTYFDFSQSIMHNEDSLGNYTEVRGGLIQQFYSKVGQKFTVPRIIKYIPSNLIDAGATNTYESWGLGTASGLDSEPDIVYFAEKVQTFDAGFFIDSFISMKNEGKSSISTIPRVLIRSDIPSEEHTTFVKQDISRYVAYFGGSGGAETWQVLTGVDSACAYDTATGINSGLPPTNYNQVTDIDISLSFWASAAGRDPQLIVIDWATMACSANADSYQDHGAPDSDIAIFDHKLITHRYAFSLNPVRTKHFVSIKRTFVGSETTEWKPVLKLAYTSAEPQVFGTGPEGASQAQEVSWTGLYASSGLKYLNDMKLENITYTALGGSETEQTGTGIVSALLIEKGPS